MTRCLHSYLTFHARFRSSSFIVSIQAKNLSVPEILPNTDPENLHLYRTHFMDCIVILQIFCLLVCTHHTLLRNVRKKIEKQIVFDGVILRLSLVFVSIYVSYGSPPFSGSRAVEFTVWFHDGHFLTLIFDLENLFQQFPLTLNIYTKCQGLPWA